MTTKQKLEEIAKNGCGDMCSVCPIIDECGCVSDDTEGENTLSLSTMPRTAKLIAKLKLEGMKDEFKKTVRKRNWR